jgi:hypothetical protein
MIYFREEEINLFFLGFLDLVGEWVGGGGKQLKKLCF